LPPLSTPFPYTTLFRSMIATAPPVVPSRASQRVSAERERRLRLSIHACAGKVVLESSVSRISPANLLPTASTCLFTTSALVTARSEEHTSELQSPDHLV